VFLIMFKTGHALPLRKRRTWCPRISRGRYAEYPRKINRSWTWHWPVHGLDPVGDRTRTGTFRVREQAASAFSPQQQSWPRTIHVRAQATASIVRHQATVADENCPQTVRSRGQSTSPNWPRTRFVRDHGPAKNRLHRCIAVSILPSVNFPVHVRIIPAYDLF
jgi:hypothetical protein